MSQIKQLLQLHMQGKGKKTIARITGMSKNTVKAYLLKVNMLLSQDKSISIRSLLNMEDPELESIFHSGNPSYKTDNERYHSFVKLIPHFVKELKRVGVTKRLLWQEYREEYPQGYKYTQFCFHLQQYTLAQNPSAVLTHQPGEALYVDFAGKKLSYVAMETGEVIDCHVFVACLPYSDYSFAMAVKTQKVEDFIHALTQCLHTIAGVPHSLVPDNLKSAVIRADRYEPTIHNALTDFANHYGTTVVPTRVRKPKDKALVENQVKLIYTRVFARIRNQTFFDLKSLNQEIALRIRAHNQTRMQNRDYCREEKFLSKEQSHLISLPNEPYKLKYQKTLTVAQNNHIYLSDDKCYYSVPYVYIGQKAKVIYTRETVHIYCKGKQVAIHARGYANRGYATKKEHLCSQHQHYLKRSPEYYIRQARHKSSVLEQLVEAIFKQDRYPEQLYRTCDGLFSLMRKTDLDSFEKACKKALEYEKYSYQFVLNVLKNKTYNQDESQQKPLPKHDNIRGAAYYQLKLNFKSSENHE